MVQNRYRLRGTSLAELGARAVREYGPSARVISSERVSAKGVAGFFGGAVYEATVEVPEENTASTEAPNGRVRLPAPRTTSPPGEDLVTIGHTVRPPAALPPAATPPPAEQQVRPRHAAVDRQDSARDEDSDFTHLLEGLRKALREGDNESDGGARNRAPSPLREAGALVVVTGVTGCIEAAQQVADLEECVVWQLQEHMGDSLREARRSVLHARAEAVSRAVPVVAIVPVAFPRVGIRSGADHPVINEADQLWAAVDLRRKTEDTRRWLAAVAERHTISGAVLVGSEETLTPDTGHRLGLPVLGALRKVL